MAHVIDAIISLKDQFSSTLRNVNSNLTQFQRQANYVAKDTIKVGKAVESVGKSLTAGVTLPVLGIGAAASKIGMEFEASMSNVSALSGATGEELKKLEKAARDAGASTSKSAKDAADALGYMALAGYDTKQMHEALMPILRLSEAGNLDLARTSDLVTDSLSSLGKSTADLPVYLDQVAKTAASSNTNIDALMEALIVSGGTIKNLNTPLDEANTLLGVLANRGIKGSEAGNSFNSILINLTSGAGQAGEAMEKLGLSAFDSNGKFKGVTNVLLELKEKTAGMTEEQRNMYLAMIGGKTQITTLQALLSGVGEEYTQLRNKIKNSNGALEEMAKTMQENNKGSITQLKSALEELGLKIYDNLKPSIASLIEFLQKLTDKLNSLSPEQQQTIVKFAMIAASIGPVLLIIGKLTKGIGNTIRSFSKLTRSIQSAGGIMGWLTSPGMKIMLVMVAVAGIALVVIKNWDGIKKKAIELKDKLLELKDKSIDKVKDAFNAVKEAVINFTEKIKNLKDNVIDGVKGKFNSFKQTLIDNQGAIKTTATILGVIFGPALIKTGIQATIAGGKIAISFIRSIIKAGLEAVISGAKITANFIATMAATGIQAVINGAKITVSFIGSIIKAGIEAGIAGAKITAGLIKSIITTGIEAIKTGAIITGKLIVAIVSYAAAGWKTVAAIAAQTAAWLFQKGVVVAHTIGLAALKVAQIGLTGATKLLAGAIKLLNLAFVATPIGWIVLGIAAVIAAAIGLYKAWKTNWGGIQDKTKSVVDFIKARIESIKETFENVKNKCKEFGEKIKEVWGNIKEFLKHPIKGTVELAKKGAEWVGDKVSGKNALGTSYWGGGYSLVGEHGPEIVQIDKGAKVYDTKTSKNMLGGGNVNIAKVADTIIVREEADIDKIATALAKKIKLASANSI